LYKYDEQETLFEIIGHLFGGSNDTFRVPDLRSKKPFAEMPYYIAIKVSLRTIIILIRPTGI
jgi:microcystin-dependent protein